MCNMDISVVCIYIQATGTIPCIQATGTIPIVYLKTDDIGDSMSFEDFLELSVGQLQFYRLTRRSK